MASSETSGTSTPDGTDGVQPQPCSACRGTGRVLAGKGEAQESLPCPWCKGTGDWVPGYDAQAARVASGDT